MDILPVASLSRRLGALLYDVLAISAILMAVSAVWVIATGATIAPDSEYRRPYQISLIIAGYSYFFFFWFRDAHSTGMRAWRLRIQQINGKPITVNQAIIRLLIAPISLACFGLGYFWALISPSKHTWHDSLSKTEIVQLPKPKK